MIDPVLQEQASEWFLSNRSDERSDADRAAFDDWLESHPGAPTAYRMSVIAGDLSDNAEISAIRTSPAGRLWRAVGSPPRMAASLAACIALIAVAVSDRIAGVVDVQLAPLRGGGEIVRTAPRDRTSTRLADGTVVTLDGGTRLRVLEMGARRRIELLSGHAFFRVAKDPMRPFLVTANDKTVHAIGTAFDVRVEPEAVAFTLVEGKVRIDQSRGRLRAPITTDMRPGRQLIASDDQVWMMTPVDTIAATAWLNEQLFYSKSTVGQIVAHINNGSTQQIVSSHL